LFPATTYHSGFPNRFRIFLLTFKEEFDCFSETYAILNKFITLVGTEKTKAGPSLVSFVPFLMLMARQALNAFEAMAVFQSYQSWVTLRPGLESALIMGKWVDDPNNSTIWENREINKKEYLNTYQGIKIVSKSLPDSQVIQKVLGKINDDFMHLNPDYYNRHLKTKDLSTESILLNIEFNDDAINHKAHLYSFLHLTRFLLQSVGEMFKKEFGEFPELDANLNSLQQRFAQRVAALIKKEPKTKCVLEKIGLWPSTFLS